MDLILERSFKLGRFRLSSGVESTYYVDLRRVTTHPEGSFLAASLLLDIVESLNGQAAGGPTLGADPLAGALAVVSHLRSRPTPTFIVRTGRKEHGTGSRVEGSLEAGQRVVVFDDVVTSGGSLLRAAEAVREAGAEIAGAAALLDREEGAVEALAGRGLELRTVFRISELLEQASP